MSLIKILETFIGFFFLPLSTADTSTRSLVRSPCKTRALCVQRLWGPQYYLSSFQLFQQKWCSRGRFNCIFTLACKGPVCVDVLTSFYGRLFVEVRQFINSKSLYIVPPLRRHFFRLLTPPRFGALSRISKSSGSQSVYASVNSTCAQRPPPPPPGYCGAFARLISPGGGVFAKFALSGGRAFANPRGIPEHLTRTRFPIRI